MLTRVHSTLHIMHIYLPEPVILNNGTAKEGISGIVDFHFQLM